MPRRSNREILLDTVPTDGSSIGNTRLMEELGWDANKVSRDRYWSTRDELIDEGILTTGKGRGGSVKRASISEPNEKEISEETTETRSYQFVSQVLELWVKERRYDKHATVVSGTKRPKRGGGKWMQPDITIFGHRELAYVPKNQLDVVTFEVKLLDAVDVTVVYQALAQRRASNRSYVVICANENMSDDDWDNDAYPRIFELANEAKKFGIGLIVIDWPTKKPNQSPDNEYWDEWLEADRVEPDPLRLNEFIAGLGEDHLREKIVAWGKSSN